MNTILDVRVEDGKIVERSPYFSHRTINNQFYRGAKWFGRDYSTEDNVDMTGWTDEQIINYLDHTECPAFIGSFENNTVAEFNIDDNIFESNEDNAFKVKFNTGIDFIYNYRHYNSFTYDCENLVEYDIDNLYFAYNDFVFTTEFKVDSAKTNSFMAYNIQRSKEAPEVISPDYIEPILTMGSLLGLRGNIVNGTTLEFMNTSECRWPEGNSLPNGWLRNNLNITNVPMDVYHKLMIVSSVQNRRATFILDNVEVGSLPLLNTDCHGMLRIYDRPNAYCSQFYYFNDRIDRFIGPSCSLWIKSISILEPFTFATNPNETFTVNTSEEWI